MTRRLTAAVLACICMISFVLIMIPVRASAEETQQFTGEAVLLKQENSAYTFQITMEMRAVHTIWNLRCRRGAKSSIC